MARHARRSSPRNGLVATVIVLFVLAGVGVYGVLVRRHILIGSPTTTTSTATVVAPLLGLPTTDRTTLQRPALTVKIENTPDALPQWGIDKADVVYEEIVNGGITRLAAIFNSQMPTKIGPIRSVRPTDTQIVWPLGGLFAFSGGAQYAIDSISQAPVQLIDESNAGTAMFRDTTRQAPHNLYGDVASLFQVKQGTPIPPPALFSYSTKKIGAQQPSASHVVVGFPSIYPATWDWNKTTQSYDRTLFGQPDVTGTGVRESPKNVIVMFINYVNGIGTDASYGDLQSGGTVDIFTKDHEITGTWSRSSKSSPIVYKDKTGAVIGVTPGQTWVELLENGASLTVSP